MPLKTQAAGSSSATLFWIAAIAAVSFLETFVLVDRLTVPRDLFVLGHVAVTGALLAAFTTWSRTRLRDLLGNWRTGLAGGLIAGAFMVGFVLTGPGSPAPGGWTLAGAIVWLGLVYAAADALLLSVFPVVAAHLLCGERTARTTALLVAPLTALAISLLLTTTYHLGFPEFRGPSLGGALIGNGIMTISYLATRSAVAPVLAHICLHLAAVTFGYLNALPAPPHYL